MLLSARMSSSREQVEAIASLARLELDASELELFGSSARSSTTSISCSGSTRLASPRLPVSSRPRRRRPRRPGATVPGSARRDRHRAGPGARAGLFRVPRVIGQVAASVRECRDAVRNGDRSAVEVASRRSPPSTPPTRCFVLSTPSSGSGARTCRSARPRSHALARPAADRGPGCAQRQHLDARRPDDGIVEDLEPFVPPQRHRREARSGRGSHRRQDQLRRVRDGIVDRELCIRPDQESVGDRSDSGRAEWRLGGCRRRRDDTAGARIRHRRIDPAAGGACGIVGLKPTYGRSRVTVSWHLRRRSIRSDRWRNGRRRRARVVGDCRGGRGRRQRARTGARLHERADWRRARGAHRRAASSDRWRGGRPEVSNAIKAALDVLVARGASLVDIDLPHAGAAIPVYYLIATAEASSNLARYDGVRYGYRSPFDSAQGRSMEGRDDLHRMQRGRGLADSVPRSNGESCWAPTC